VYFGSDSAKDIANAFDNDVKTRVDDSRQDCWVGMEFKKGYVAQLKQVKYFI